MQLEINKFQRFYEIFVQRKWFSLIAILLFVHGTPLMYAKWYDRNSWLI